MPAIRRQSEFQHLREHGQFVHVSHWLAISYKKNSIGTLRWGWTISKKVGNAVVRNRLRRWGREFVRGLEKNEFDINFIFKAKTKEFYKTISHEEFDRSFRKVFEKIHK